MMILNKQFSTDQTNETWRRNFMRANAKVLAATGLWWQREPTGLEPKEWFKVPKNKKKEIEKKEQARTKRRVRKTIKYDGETFTFHIQEPGMGEGKWQEKREVPLEIARQISAVVAGFVEDDTLTMVIETSPKVLDLWTSLFAPKRCAGLPAYGFKIIQDEDGSTCFLEIPLNFTQHDVLDLYILASILDSTDACDMALDHLRNTFLQKQKLREEFRNGTRPWTDIPRGRIPNILDFEPKHMNELWEITPRDDAARVFWLDVLELKHSQAYDKTLTELSDYSDSFLQDLNKRLSPKQRFASSTPPLRPDTAFEADEHKDASDTGRDDGFHSAIDMDDGSASASGLEMVGPEEVQTNPMDVENVVKSIEHGNDLQEIPQGIESQQFSQFAAPGRAGTRGTSRRLESALPYGLRTISSIKEEAEEDLEIEDQEEAHDSEHDYTQEGRRVELDDAYFIGDSLFEGRASPDEPKGDGLRMRVQESDEEESLHDLHPTTKNPDSRESTAAEDLGQQHGSNFQEQIRDSSSDKAAGMVRQREASVVELAPEGILRTQYGKSRVRVPAQGSDSGYSSPLSQGSQSAQRSSSAYSPPPHDAAQLICAKQTDFCAIYHNHARRNLPCYKFSVSPHTPIETLGDDVEDVSEHSATRFSMTIHGIPGFKILNHTGYSRQEFRELPRIFSNWDWERVRAVNCYEQLKYNQLDYGRDMKPLILPRPVYFNEAYVGPVPCPFQDELGRWPSHPGYRNPEWHFDPEDADEDVDGDTTMLDMSVQFNQIVEEDPEQIQDQDEDNDDQAEHDDGEQNDEDHDDQDDQVAETDATGKKKKKKMGRPKKNAKSNKANDEPPPAPWVDYLNFPRVVDPDWHPTAPVFSCSGYGLESWGFQNMAW
jgi:hypothetical protein